MPVMFATPEEAELAFYDALERADLGRLMQVWSDDEEIICVHPGGLRMVGLHAVKESWHEILTQGALHIRATKLVTTQSMMSTVHSLIEEITVRSQAGSEVLVDATGGSRQPYRSFCYATSAGARGCECTL